MDIDEIDIDRMDADKVDINRANKPSPSIVYLIDVNRVNKSLHKHNRLSKSRQSGQTRYK